MAKRQCADLLDARAAAFEEAAEHLHMHWTDCNLEYQQGLIVAEKLQAEARKLHEKGLERS